VTRVTTLNYFTSRYSETVMAGSGSEQQGPDDLEQLKESLEKHLSGAPGSSLTIIPRTNSLVVTDIASNVDRVIEMAKRLDIETPQVLIEAKIVEVNAEWSRDLGITTNFNSARTRNTQVGGGTSANFPAPGFGVSPGTFGALAAGPGGSAFDFFLRSIGGNDIANLQIILSAAEQNGLAKTLATPRVTTLHNKEAVISSGQRIPYTSLGSIAAQGGTNLVATVQFVDAALELAVTPHVIADGKVMMKVRASRNTADFDNTVFQNPTINTREARNQVLVADGDTVVIGGIYTQDDFRDDSGTPYLKDVPVLGHLFKSTGREKNTVELIFLITPRVITSPAVMRASGPAGAQLPGAASLALEGASR
jgi:type IV pilus assembly protein PilQ